MIELESYRLDSERDITDILRLIRQEAHTCGYSRLETEQFLLGISEIATNAIRHASDAVVDFSILNKGGILKIVVSDSGPGIANLDLAKVEGFSTIHTSLGIGLVVAERSVDLMDIKTEVGQGTIITLEKHRPIDKQNVDYGLVSISDSKYDFNGDQYIIKEYNGDSILVALIDGPGQGYDAYAIANSCTNYIAKHYLDPIDLILANLDFLMNNSNDQVGITASIMRITPGKMIYKGYGDTHAYLVKDGFYHTLTNQGGRLGHLKKYRSGISEFSFEDKIQIVLCTDGLSVLPLTKTLNGSAQFIANSIFDEFHKPNGDASILCLKYQRS